MLWLSHKLKFYIYLFLPSLTNRGAPFIPPQSSENISNHMNIIPKAYPYIWHEPQELSIHLGKALHSCVTLNLFSNICEYLMRETEDELEHPKQDRVINAPNAV